MYQLRPFRNSDPPHLAEIWRSQPPQRGILQQVSAPILEFGVFSKQHFDRNGLIVATRDGRPRGFVHAGFGPNEGGTAIDTTLGTTHMLMLHSSAQDDALADDLLAASENYLQGRGSQVLYAGGIQPLNSFYLGLYGGSEIPGVLRSDALLQRAARASNYREMGRVQILQCDLVRFRPPVNRELRALKRTTELVETLDPRARNWWEACVWGCLQRNRFQLLDRYQHTPIATATFWDVQPMSAGWGMCTAGLYELYVEPAHRRRGVASYLLGETLRVLRRRGVSIVEAQTMSTNEAALAFYDKLGFSCVDEGLVFRKESTPVNGVGH
ncbi:MAG: GNAT family N-acetyltransferase [Planctomycetales bacterium]|nr:GNAT family N-acetyltransferase [Planctomycetales bacterium]